MCCRQLGSVSNLRRWIALGAFSAAVALASAALTPTLNAAVATEDDNNRAKSGSVWDGIYTEGQAKRGQTLYEENCVSCHQIDLSGQDNAPPLVGHEFVTYWNGHSVGDLFEVTRTTMPKDSPGSLRQEQYADLLAYLLSANKFPAGETELQANAARLKQIKWVSEPQKAHP